MRALNIIFSNSSSVPIYEQIINQIKLAIINKEILPEEPLPSIRGLAKDLQISVITTKRAYEELERDGFIESVTGKGSFVAGKNTEFIKEEHFRIVEEYLQKAVDTANMSDIGLDELIEILKTIYIEE
jgi:GntR family transcriptional regulator